ncbi:MAG: hypothetical protein FWE09_07680, partial [Treponema sp.]|nr:hypothetical protein [Treponema sp.]
MPYISVKTSVKLSQAQELAVKAEFGRLVEIIPGKTEENTMVDFSDSRSMYKAGNAGPCAFVEMRLWRKAEIDAKKRFVEEAFAMLRRELAVEEKNIFINVLEFDE